MQLIEDKYLSKAFVNAESLLAFDGVDDAVVINDVNFRPGINIDFSFEIIFASQASSDVVLLSKEGMIELTLMSGNDLRLTISSLEWAITTIQTGRLYHLIISYDSVSQLFTCFLNGIEVSNYLFNSTNFLNTLDWNLGSSSLGTNHFLGLVGLMRFYYCSLNETQALQLAKKPYDAPDNIKTFIVGEYIVSRSFFKDVDNLYRKGFDTVIWFDSTDQYVDFKPEIFSNSHGTLTGWDDNEVTSLTGAASIKDFYNIENILSWSNDLGSTEINSGLQPILHALAFNGASDYISISSYTIGQNFFISYIDDEGNWYFENDLEKVEYEVSGSDLIIGKNGSSYFKGYIIGVWDGNLFSEVDKIKVKNNTFTRQTPKADILNINFNQEGSNADTLAEINGRTVALVSEEKSFVAIDLLRGGGQNIPVPIGEIWNKEDSLIASQYAVNSGVFDFMSDVHGNYIQLSGGTANFGHYITLVDAALSIYEHHSFEEWIIEHRVVIEVGTNSYGFGVGVSGSSDYEDFYNAIRIALDSNNAGFFERPTLYDDGFSDQVTGDSITPLVSGEFVFQYERSFDTYIIRVLDATRTELGAVSVQPPGGYTNAAWRFHINGRWALWNFGGSHQIRSHRIEIKARKDVAWAMVGDSNGQGFKTGKEYRWFDQFIEAIGEMEINSHVQAGVGNTLKDAYRSREIMKVVNPVNLLICLGTNDFRFGSTTVSTDLSDLLDWYEANLPDTRLVICSPVANDTEDYSTLRDIFQAAANTRNLDFVDFYQATKNTDDPYLDNSKDIGDGIHINATGHTAIKNKLISTLGLLPEDRLLISLGDTSHIVSSPDKNARHWNSITSDNVNDNFSTAGFTVTDLIDVNNNNAGISFTIDTPADDDYGDGSGRNDIGTTQDVGDYVSPAGEGSLFTNNTGVDGQISLGGLLSEKTYLFKFWGCRSGVSDERIIEIATDADFSDIQSYDGANLNGIGNLDPNHNAEFTVSGVTNQRFYIRSAAGGSQFGYISVIDITII